MNTTIGAIGHLLAPAIELCFMVMAFAYGGPYFGAILKAVAIGVVVSLVLPQLVGTTVLMFLVLAAWNGLARLSRSMAETAAQARYDLCTLQILYNWRMRRRLRRLARKNRRYY